MISITRLVTRSLDRVSRYLGKTGPEHLQTARWGEVEAYFYLRSLGYRVVARNFRASGGHGEIDLIGWDDGALCFIEVKTHSQPGLMPPEMAVDEKKKSDIRDVARRYVQQLSGDAPPYCRFDVVSVVLGKDGRGPMIRLHKGAFGWRPGRYRAEAESGERASWLWWRRT